MAAEISLSDCSVHKKFGGEYCTCMIITPATADSADYIDTTTLVRDNEILGILGWDVDTGDAITATYGTGTGYITLDAGGSDTNSTYAVEIKYIGADMNIL